MALADWSTVADFAATNTEAEAEQWSTFKSKVEQALLAAFTEQFPGLATMIVYRGARYAARNSCLYRA